MTTPQKRTVLTGRCAWRSPGIAAIVGGLLSSMLAVDTAQAEESTRSTPPVTPRGLPPGHPVSSLPMPPRGVTLGINGAILTGVGATFMGLAAVSLAEGASCARACGFWGETSGKLLLAFGAPAFAVGLPLFAVGVHRHRRWKAWERRRMLDIQPRIGGLRGGVTAGVALRF